MILKSFYLIIPILLLISFSFLATPAQAAINTPLKVCHPASGNPNDLCPVFAWARPGITFLSAQNAGNDQPQLTFFTVTDLAGGTGSVQGIPVTTNSVGQVVSANSNSAISLISGHQYRWTVQAFDPSFINSSPPDFVPAFFNYDSTLPTYALSPTPPTCYVSPAQPTTLSIVANDPTSAGVASGVAQVWVKLDSLPETLAPLTNPPNNYTYTYPVLASGTHQVFVKVIDNAGNFSGPLPTGYQASPDLTFRIAASSCTRPWLQTLEGDVHSNGSINTPGGPP